MTRKEDELISIVMEHPAVEAALDELSEQQGGKDNIECVTLQRSGLLDEFRRLMIGTYLTERDILVRSKDNHSICWMVLLNGKVIDFTSDTPPEEQ